MVVKKRKEAGVMAEKKVEKFAVISSNAEVPVVRKMGVPQSHIVGINQREQLIRSMNTGDVLCVGSVGYVARSVEDLVRFLDFLYMKGILFQTGCEKALCFSQTVALAPAVRSVLVTIAKKEADFVGMIRSSRLKEQDQLVLINRIYGEYLAFVCLMFNASNGVIRQRNL